MTKRKPEHLAFLTCRNSPFADGYDIQGEARVLAFLIESDTPNVADPLFSRLFEYEERVRQLRKWEARKSARIADVRYEFNRTIDALWHPPRPERAPELGPKPRLVLRDAGYWVSSLVIAEHFDKLHNNVLRDIRNLILDIEETEGPGTSQLDFESVKETMSYRSKEGVMVEKETSRIGYYLLSRDGFSLLAMGFTGKKALIWKRRFLKLFKMYEHALLNPQPLAPLSLTMSLDDLPKRLPASYRTQNFLAMFHALERQRSASILLWVLVNEFGVIGFPPHGREPGYRDWGSVSKRVTVRRIVEACDGLISASSVYRGRQKLLAIGLLAIQGKSWEVAWEPVVKLLGAAIEKTRMRLAPAPTYPALVSV